MSLAYTRAYFDRDATTNDGPLRFVAATGGRKGDNIDLRMAGAQLDRYLANPVFLYGHRYFSRDDLPIGRGDNTMIKGDKLLIDVSFDGEDEFAQKVERKYRGGWMNAVSIGFDVLAWEGGHGSYWAGGVAEQWELLELSAVPVPMDASAVVESGRAASLARLLDAPELLEPDVPVEVLRDAAQMWLSVRVSNELAQQADALRLGVAIARGLKAAAVAPIPVPDIVPAPIPAAGVDETAAQDLLAAFTI